MEEQHLASLSDDEGSSFDDDNSSDSDSNVEAASTIDECENELVRLSTYLQLESEFDNDDDQNFEWPEPPSTLNSSDSSDIEELHDSQQMLLSTTPSNNGVIQEQYIKRKRRQWTVKEKLDAITLFENNQSGKRKRLEGGGKKNAPADIRREKVTFSHLEKEGRRIAKQLNHSIPSSSWYIRFMKRHGLSLQRPKRQDKVPIDEVHRLANSFYMFNRRVSLWSIKRGAMGAFIPEDICIMDESPLALFGDQAKRSINDIGTNNEINGYIIMLTVFPKNQRMQPVVLFKGKGNIGVDERQKYAKGVHVIFTPKGVINGQSMNMFCKKWLEKVSDGHPKLLIINSANSHLKPEIIQNLRKKNVVVSIIPKGCTQYLQLLDTSVFSVFKNHYQAAANEYIDNYTSRSKIKSTAKQQRILCTRLISTAWIRTQKSFDLERAFLDIGYTWIDESPVSIRTLPGFIFDPSTVTISTTNNDNNEEEEEHNEDQLMAEEKKKNSYLFNMNNKKLKQLNLDQFLQE
ncbi:unnamed protein product [Rotaria sordida]|uniref:DDE-1 domain-containing protein n=3 Tax=Rotaria sordida TaxID=392033 RepID=A0A815UT60_9BILA|nr:unnamed protein product [Rotaria sordida]